MEAKRFNPQELFGIAINMGLEKLKKI